MAGSSKRRGKRYTPRLIRIPVTNLRDDFGLHMHMALVCLEREPSEDPFNTLAHAFDLLQIALQNDKKHAHEARLITGGASALVQVRDRVARGIAPMQHELGSIRVGVNAIDGLLGKMSVTDLYLAGEALHRFRAEDRAAAA